MLGTYMATGEIDYASAPAFRADLHDTIDSSDVERVVVDCTDITFMDSAGFHALVDATAYAVRHDRTLVIHNMSPQCNRLIRLCDFANDLHVEPAA